MFFLIRRLGNYPMVGNFAHIVISITKINIAKNGIAVVKSATNKSCSNNLSNRETDTDKCCIGQECSDGHDKKQQWHARVRNYLYK